MYLKIGRLRGTKFVSCINVPLLSFWGLFVRKTPTITILGGLFNVCLHLCSFCPLFE